MTSFLDKARIVETQEPIPSFMAKAKPAAGKSDVKGGIVGEVLTGNTQRFGKTAGEALAAPKNADLYSQSLTGHTKIQNDLIKTIEAKKKLGQDASRLEHALQDHLRSTPKLEDFTGDVINKSAESILGEAAGTVLEASTGGLLSSGAKTAVAKELPFLSKVGQGAKIGATYGAVGGATQAMQDDESATGVIGSALKGAAIGAPLGAGAEFVGAGLAKVPGLVKKAANPQNIMNRVARLTPSDAREFSRLSGGESHGDYLVRTNNFGNPEKIVNNEFDKFIASRNEADMAFESLPGKWNSKQLDTVLSDLAEREARIGVPSSDTTLVAQLMKKNTEGGLTNAEINQAKRIYERTVKTDFIRSNAPEGIERATRLDNALRDWQMQLADSLGYTNARNINKQTQLSRFMVDKLGKQTIGKSGLDAVNITDWIMLSGANPTNLMGFFAKKIAGSKANMARLADFMAKNLVKDSFIKADIGASKIPLLPAGRSPAGTSNVNVPINLRGASTMEGRAPKVFNQDQLRTIPQLPGPSGKRLTPNPDAIKVAPRGSNMEITSKEGITPSKQKQPQPKEKSPKKPYRSIVPKKKDTVNKEIKSGLMKIDSIKPSQSGEDLYNETSEGYAKGYVPNKDDSAMLRLGPLKDPNSLPAIKVDENGKIIDGNHRWAAAKLAGLKEIKVEVVKKKKLPIKLKKRN